MGKKNKVDFNKIADIASAGGNAMIASARKLMVSGAKRNFKLKQVIDKKLNG